MFDSFRIRVSVLAASIAICLITVFIFLDNRSQRQTLSSELTYKYFHTRDYPARSLLLSAYPNLRASIAIYQNISVTSQGRFKLPDYQLECLLSPTSNLTVTSKQCAKIERFFWTLSPPLSKAEPFPPPDGRMEVIGGSTAYFSIEPHATNIAHYSGRFGLIVHILRRARMYSGHPRGFRRIIIDTNGGDELFDMFADSFSWQGGSLRAILGENKDTEIYLFSTISAKNLASVDSEHTKLYGDKKSAVYITKDASLLAGYRGISHLKFERLVLPGILWGSFFTPDFNISSHEQLQDTSFDNDIGSNTDSNAIPYDSTYFRDVVSQEMATKNIVLDMDANGKNKKRLVYLKRSGRRAFTAESEQLFQSTVKNFCANHGYTYAEQLGNASFISQVSNVIGADITVGLHGANLVNSMFMNTAGTLLEIMPFGYDHPLFVNAGGTARGYQVYRTEGAVTTDILDHSRSVVLDERNIAEIRNMLVVISEQQKGKT